MALRLGLKTLNSFSRQMSTMLDAGLPIRRALAVVERGAKSPQKALYRRIGQRVEEGDTLSEALEREGRTFPLLYVRLVKMGETVGSLDKVFKRLADYYEFIRTMWLRLLELTYPIIQYFAAVGILTVVTYIMDHFIVETEFHIPRPIPGMHAPGVFIAGMIVFFAPIAAYFAATRSLGGLRATHELMIRIPVIGKVMRMLALARFSWSMELMTDSGVSIFNALEWSMQATANGAFEGRLPGIVARVKDGLPLAQSLDMSGLFPPEYVELMHVAEESGSMPDTFQRLARNYFEEAERALKAMTTALGWLIWCCVAAVIIFFIFRFFMFYIGVLTGALNEAGG